MSTFLLAGGGTAGHVTPLLAVADRLLKSDSSAEVLVLGTAEGLEARLVPDRGYRLLTIPRLPLPRRANVAALRFPRRFAAAVAMTRTYISEFDVKVVVGFGGYASAPAYVAAWRLGIPIVVHEANAKPGFANRLGALLARRTGGAVGVAFSSTRLRGGVVVGMPLRQEIESLDRRAKRADAVRHFGLDPAKPVLLVTGGSTGARSINTTILAASTVILGSGWQILHIAGARAELSDPHLNGYRLEAYCDHMELAIAAADLAVARAGAATVSEFAAVGLPAIYVPYPVGNGEQRFNAAEVVAAGGGLLVSDVEFTPSWISARLIPILRDRATILEMAARALSVGSKDGAERTVQLVLTAQR